jgi:hypothetical protein
LRRTVRGEREDIEEMMTTEEKTRTVMEKLVLLLEAEGYEVNDAGHEVFVTNNTVNEHDEREWFRLRVDGGWTDPAR